MEVEEDSTNNQERLRSVDDARHSHNGTPVELLEIKEEEQMSGVHIQFEGDSDEEDKMKGSGIIGFFKKTFSSVKKTFESTFKQQ